jgi:peptidoglycan/LPS O-acetylase OafA/YrhL
MAASTTTVDRTASRSGPSGHHHHAAIRSSQVRRTGGVRFPQVDSLRAIAALSVFLFHVGGLALPGPTIGAYTSRLNVGVTIFFVISGFLLYRPFAAARLEHDHSTMSSGRYAWHRFLRIVPAYWVALTVIAIWLGLPGVFGRDAVVYYGFGQVYSLRTNLGGLGQAWTLSIEVAFYVFLPFWAWGMSRIRASSARQRLYAEVGALVGLAVFSLIYKLVFAAGVGGISPQLQFALSQALPRYLDVFAIGMLLAVASVWFEEHPLPRPLAFIDAHPWISWLLAAVAMWVLATRLGLPSTNLGRISNYKLISMSYGDAVVALALVLPAVIGNQDRGWPRRILRHRALIWIGVVSYGLYLWHLAVLTQLDRWRIPQDIVRWTGLPAMLVWIVVGIGPALALAAASWYWIEKPALRFKKIPPPAWLRRLPGYAQRGWPARLAIGAVAALLVWVVIGTALTPGGSHAAKGAVLAKGGSWVYMVATYDTRTLRVYENGRLIASAPGRGRPGPSTAGIEVGTYLGGSSWSGPIKYAAVYRTVLSADVIRLHQYVGRKSWSQYLNLLATDPDLAGLWQDGLPVGGGRASLRGGPSGAFSVEAWLKAYRRENRVLVDQPKAWFLKTDYFGYWNFDILSGARQFSADAKVGPPLSAAGGS